MIRIILITCLFFSSTVSAELVSHPVIGNVGSEATPGVKLVAAFKIAREAEDGTPISGVSGLAWDEDEQLLYAVTDRGRIHHFTVVTDETGSVKGIERQASHRLRDLQGNKLKGKWRDAESAFVLNGSNSKRGDSLISIGFEQSPRIVRYKPNGYQSGRYHLPKQLDDKKLFNTPNNMFEATALHPEHGVMLIPQRPMKGRETNALYRIRDNRTWKYIAENEMGNSISALEVLPDGSLLVMERAWDSIWNPLVISFKHVVLGDEIRASKIARLSSMEGWNLDNFEGLTRYRDNLFFIVSDDNQKEIQRTLIFLIELDLPAVN